MESLFLSVLLYFKNSFKNVSIETPGEENDELYNILGGSLSEFGHSFLKRVEMVVFEVKSISKRDSLHMSPEHFRL